MKGKLGSVDNVPGEPKLLFHDLRTRTQAHTPAFRLQANAPQPPRAALWTHCTPSQQVSPLRSGGGAGPLEVQQD